MLHDSRILSFLVFLHYSLLLFSVIKCSVFTTTLACVPACVYVCDTQSYLVYVCVCVHEIMKKSNALQNARYYPAV